MVVAAAAAGQDSHLSLVDNRWLRRLAVGQDSSVELLLLDFG